MTDFPEIDCEITMKEIDPIAETDIEISHIVGIEHETTIKMTIEVTIEKKIIGISRQEI